MRIYWHPTAPDHAAVTVCRTWFSHLQDVERDVLLRHVCAAEPVPLDVLARDHLLLRQTVRRHRNQLVKSLNQAFTDDPAALSAVSAVERDLHVPTEWRILITRHPWLAVAVTEQHPLAPLHLLLGLRWRDASHGPWLFDGDLDQCIAATLRALALGPGEVMSHHTVQRRLREASLATSQDPAQLHRWLSHCGLVYQPARHEWTRPATPPAVTESAHPGEWAEIENENLSLRQYLSHALARIAELLPESYPDSRAFTLGEILERADQLPGELGQLARRVRDAVLDPVSAGNFTANTPPHTLSLTQPPHSTSAPQPHHPQERSRWLGRLAGDLHQLQLCRTSQQSAGYEVGEGRQQWLHVLRSDIHKILCDADTPLTAWDISNRLGRYVQLRTLRKVLQGDPQCRMTGRDAWTFKPDRAHPVHQTPRDLDAAVEALTRADRPMSTAELKEEAHLTIQSGYLKQKLDADPRFQRSAKDRWALTEWDMPVYKPIKELVSDLIDRHDGAVDVDEAIRCLRHDFDIKESTLRQVMSSPPFTARGGKVRRLTHAAPYQHTVTDEEGDDDDAPTADDLIKGMGLT
ncbi:hypothetical protein [Streptomyces sp. NPDC003635]